MLLPVAVLWPAGYGPGPCIPSQAMEGFWLSGSEFVGGHDVSIADLLIITELEMLRLLAASPKARFPAQPLAFGRMHHTRQLMHMHRFPSLDSACAAPACRLPRGTLSQCASAQSELCATGGHGQEE